MDPLPFCHVTEKKEQVSQSWMSNLRSLDSRSRWSCSVAEEKKRAPVLKWLQLAGPPIVTEVYCGG